MAARAPRGQPAIGPSAPVASEPGAAVAVGRTRGVERGLALGDREAPLVERLADDHAGEVDLAQAGERAQVLERRRSRRSRGSARARPRRRGAPRRGRGPRACRRGRRRCRRTRARRGRRGARSRRAPASAVVWVQPAVEMWPPRTSTETSTRGAERRDHRRRGSRRRGTPPCRGSRARRRRAAPRGPPGSERSPPPYCTGTPVSPAIRSQVLDRARLAVARAVEVDDVQEARARRRPTHARPPAGRRGRRSGPRSRPSTRRTALPSRMSIAG